MQKNIVLLGGDGFIGKNLREALAEQGISSVVLDKSLGCNLSAADGQAAFERCLASASNKCIDVVMCAANVGAKLFNSNPVEPFFENLKIDTATIETMKNVAASSNAEFHVSYCSTSEVYPSLENPSLIPYARPASFCASNGRSLYAQEKLLAETLLNYEARNSSWLKSLRIFRLFNVSGKHQKRGVVYDMVKSAVQSNEIHFSENASREITFAKDAVDQMLSKILSRESGTWDITSKKHIWLGDLAACIREALSRIDSKFECIKTASSSADSFMPNRGTTPVMRTSYELRDFTTELIRSKIIDSILAEIQHGK